MFALMQVDYRHYRHPAVVFSLLSAVVALLLLAYFLPATANTHRWIRFGAFSFQPAELAKLAVVVFMAYFLERRRDSIDDIRFTLVPVGLVTLLVCGLIVMQPDLGTAVAIAGVVGLLLFAAGLNLRWVGAAAALSGVAFYLLVYQVPWRRERLFAFLDPWSDPLDSGFQIIQSLTSVGSGGIAGVGLMEGHQKLFYLPEPHTDFIFAVVGEELGLVGTTIVLGLFGVFLWRGLRTALRAPDPLGMHLALGLTMMVTLQAFLNMSVVLGLLPTKGIPLPFLSYGGSSFLIMLAAVGILMNVSQRGD
jgi:cell division protein FtsW